MSLSPTQERFIANYLRDVALQTESGVPVSRAQRSLDLLESRIRQTIASRYPAGAQDADVAKVLDELGAPESHARQIQPEPGARTAEDAVWMGVCAWWAEKLDAPAKVVRIGVFISGLVTGPLALWGYVAAYVHMRLSMPVEKRPTIDYVRIAWNVGTCFVIATVLSWVLDYALWGLQFGHQRIFERPLPSAGAWGWIEYEGPGYYPLTLLTTIPLAVLAGLPLAGGWSRSLRRLYFAVLTLYGIYLSYGLASLVAGLVIEMVKQFGGVNLMDYLPTT